MDQKLSCDDCDLNHTYVCKLMISISKYDELCFIHFFNNLCISTMGYILDWSVVSSFDKLHILN